MAKKRSLTPLSALKKSRKFRDKLRHKSRRMHLEHLEDRRVMATAPVVIQPNNAALLNAGNTLNIAPRDLTFTFSGVPGIDPTTITNGIKLTRAGNDGTFGTNDVVVSPGFLGLGKNGSEVVMRFAETLPDDIYRIQFFGAASTPAPNAPIVDTNGNLFNSGANFQLDFRLDLGAQVTAVVPQPVRRVGGILEMTEPVPTNPTTSRSTRNIIHVYFNNDDLNVASAQRPEFYRLYVTRNTLDPNDDTEILPTSVEYDPVLDKATLIFGTTASPLNLDELVAPIAGDPDAARSIRLRIGTDEGRRLLTTPTAGLAASQTPVTRLTSDPGSTFLQSMLGTPFDIGGLLTAGVQGSTVAYAQAIEAQPYDLDWPGGEDEPGHREIPVESHVGPDPLPAAGGLNALFDTQDGIRTQFYNFRPDIGTIPDGRGGTQPAFNLITENQKERAREIFALYSKYSGIQFVESATAGITVATGDLRALDPTIPTGPGGIAGLAGATLCIMDNAEIWNDLYGQNWFQVAMHEIGHTLGQGHTYDLPPLTIQGSDPALQFNSPGSEPVFPGDHDITHMRHMYRAEGKDIDLFRFTLDGTGVLTAETFAERLPNSSNLDTMIRLYQLGSGGVVTEIARNDDYFSMDSHLQLTLGAGTYYIGISAAGNDKYDANITDSGMFGTTQGAYELKLDFRKSATQSIVDAVTPASPNPVPVITDTQAVAFDGDADGTPGGVYNHWFRAVAPTGSQAAGKARVLFVDKVAPASNNVLATAGSLATPYNQIDVALAAAQPYDIVRIIGNDPLNNDGTTTADRFRDNLPYRIGFDDLGAVLEDGASLDVPKNVTVVIDAGAVFQMRRSAISVGSTDPSAQSDRSGGALQVQGTPYSSVIFTSLDEDGANGIGTDFNSLIATAPAPGEWGGISFKNDLDRADGRFDAERVGVFLNYVNHADIRYGGGQVQVNSNFIIVNPIDMISSRPTITHNTITRAGDAAMAANPDSFEETNFQAPIYFPTFSDSPGYNPSGVAGPLQTTSYTLDYKRVGPDIHGNKLVEVLAGGATVGNTTNGLFVRTRTPAGAVLEELTVAGRFDDTDIVHVLQENLVVRGTPAGPTHEQTAPPTGLIIVDNPALNASFTPIPGNFSAGDTVEYKLTYIDLLGNEGVASQTFTLPQPVASSGSSIKLSQLPDPDVPNPDFVARRLYRRINGLGANGDANFTLVDQIPASTSEYVDTRAPHSGFAPTLKVLSSSILRPRLDASLVIDPSIVVKADGARIEVGHGANLLAEGQAGQEVVFTSLADDRYGAGGTFDTKNDNLSTTPKTPLQGDWGGIFFSSDSKGSIDNAVFAYGGGLSRIEGNFAGFNVIEVHQAVVRVAHSKFEFNDNGAGGQAPGDRSGRGANASATIFVRGAQPIVIGNTVLSNTGAFININANALNSDIVVDSGRMTNLIAREPGHYDNNGPLIFGNKLRANTLNGLVVRGATLTTDTVWDDTDIVHVLFDAINVPDFHTFGGLRLESTATESLVVKASGATAGFTATGRPLEIDDRIGGTIQVLGQPGFPVVLTSFTDDTSGAGTTPEGIPQTDTNGDSFLGILPTLGEVNNGTLIDNDTAAGTIGHLRITPTPGGNATTIGVTERGQTLLFTNQDFLNELVNFVDVGPNGAALNLGATTITTPPTLIGNDLVQSAGNFAGANGQINWTVTTRIINGQTSAINTLTFTAATGTLGALRLINYLNQDVLVANDDLLYQVGVSGRPNFRLYTLDNVQRIGLAQGGVYQAGPGLVNATWDGFAADRAPDLRTLITGAAGATFNPTGVIDLVDMPNFTDPALGAVNGLNDVTTAMSWTVNPTATTATITTFLDVISRNPAAAGTAGEWQGITIDRFANDRNVETILEQESATGDGLANAVPQKAQFIGALGPIEKSTDENLRLGFTVHGLINQNADVDVYSFQAKSGTEIWIDFDRTTMALDSVVELVNNTGVVLARSNNSTAENAGAEALTGIARKMQKNPPYEGQDFYTINTRDAGMRVVLEGPANTTNTYFLRVRSASRIRVTEISQGGATGVITTLVQGGTNRATQVMQAGGPTLATILEGGSAAVAETVRGGTGLVTERMRGGGPTFSTAIQGASGSVAQIVQGGSTFATELMRGGSLAVTTLTQGSVGVNEQQRLTFTVPPTTGTFTLTFNGQTTAPLPFNASAAAVQTALVNLSNIGPADVSVALVAGSWFVTFTGALGNQNVPQLAANVSELQQVNVPFAAPFTLEFAGQVTAVLPLLATPAQVQAELEALSNIAPGDVTVTGAAGGPYSVQFSGAYANQNVAEIAVNSREIQRVALAGTSTTATFTLGFNAQTTAAIAYNASASTVQAALEALPTIGAGNVLVTGNAGGPWDVAFRGALSGQNVPSLLVSVNEIQSFVLPATPTGGAFSLTFSGQTTAAIPFNATAAQVQTELENLSNIAPGDVAVTLAAGVFTVTFQGAYANIDVPQLTGATNELQRVTAAVAGAALTLSFAGQTAAPIPGTADAAQVQAALESLSNIAPGDVIVTGAASGPWDVEFTGAYANTNVPLIAVLAVEVIQGGGPTIATVIDGANAAIAEVVKGGTSLATELTPAAVAPTVTTLQDGSVFPTPQLEAQTVNFPAVPTGGVFTLTFNGQTTGPISALATSAQVQAELEALSNIAPGDVLVFPDVNGWLVIFSGAYAFIDLPPMTANVSNEIQRVTAVVPGNDFTLTFNGQKTASIPGNASAALVQAELEALSNIAPGDVAVTGPAGGPWFVEFTGTYATQNVAAMVIGQDEIQRVTLQTAATGGSFTLTFAGQTTAAIAFDATAAAVQAALVALPAIGAGNVTVTGSDGGPWDVAFAGALSSQDLAPLTSSNNEVQNVSFPGGATGGTFTLTFSGQTTAALPFNATAAQVQTALENLSNIAPGDVVVTLNAGVWTVAFQGAYANTNVPQLTGFSAEIQRVTAPYPGSPFTLNFDGQVTAVIPANATAAQVQTALEALSNIAPLDISVTGPAGGPWDISFAGNYLNQNVPEIFINDREIQTVSLLGSPTTGNFTLAFRGQTTAALPVNASAAAVQAALAGLSTIGAGNVAVTGAAGGPWSVAFTGFLANEDVQTIVAAIDEIQSFTLPGSPTAGTFQLTFNGQTTAPIPFNASAATVQAALEALSNVNPGDVLVAFAGGTWTVTFTGAYANQNVLQMTGTTNEVQRITSPVAGGALTLSFNGQVTALIPGNATAAQVQAALEALSNINPGDVAVTGPAGGPYDVQFTGAFANSNVPEIVIFDVQIMQANAPTIATLTQGGGGLNERQSVTLQGNPVGGAFTLTFNGQRTAAIPFNASAAAVQSALEALSNINPGDVAVSFAAGAWTITFTGALANTNLAQMTGNSNEFQRVVATLPGVPLRLTFGGQTTAAIPAFATAAQIQAALEGLSNIAPGDVAVTGAAGGPWDVEFTGVFANSDALPILVGQDEVQQVTLPAGSAAASFALTFNGQTTPQLPFNSTASAVEAALAALSSIGVGNVVVSGAAGGPWDVRFTGVFTQVDVSPMTVAVFVNEVQRVTLDGSPTEGTFTLTFNGQTTAPIPFNASAAAVQVALVNLSNINPGDVAVTGNAGGPYEITYLQAFANQNLPPISVDANGLIGGLTNGAYQMQVRLREIDEIGGSTVRFAKIANAVNGIRVLGQPVHSPLAGEQTEGAAANDTQLTAQNTGNLLNTDRGLMAIAGNLTAATDIDWYRFDVSYGATQNALPSGPQFWETIFDMDYTDGLARPNTAFYVFDTNGRLILTSRDSNVADDQPSPAPGSGISDLTRGSAGGADPYIGTYALPAGVGAPITYYIAVASDARFPSQMDQFFQAAATSPLFRLEPLDSVHRIVEDHVNSFLTRGTSAAPDQTTLVDANSAVPFNLGDVVLYINMSGIGDTERTQLVTVDPFTGENETDLGVIAQDYHDIAFSQDNDLFALTRDTDDPGVTLKDSESGNYLEIDTGLGTSTLRGDDGIITYDSRTLLPSNNPFGQAIQYNAMAFSDIDFAVAAGNRTNERLIAVGNRGDINNSTDPNLNRRRNIAYSLSPTTGQALVDQGATHIYPQTGANNAMTDAFELGEILTAPRLTPVRDATDGVGPAGWAFTEGLTFDIQTDVSTNRFEFDAGYEVQQNFNFSTGSVIRDGYFFLLDQDTALRTGNETLFQFDTGVSLAVILGTLSTAIPDATTFTVTAGGVSRIFEFDRDGTLGAGTVGIDIQTFFPGTPPVVLPPFTADVIATKIANAINTQTSAAFPVQALVGPSGTRISLVATGNQPPNFITANVFATGLQNRLVRDGETGAAPVIQAIDPTLVTAGDVLEGQTFSLTINTTGNPLTNPRIVFEFSADAVLAQPASNSYVRVDTSGIAPPLGTPLPNANSTTLANRIAGAINGRATIAGAELPLSAIQLGDRVMINGAGMVSTGTAPTAGDPYFAGTAGLVDLASGVANGGLLTVLIPAEESFTAAQIGANVSTTVINNSIYTAGGAFDRINFPPALITAPVTKITPQGIDVTGVPIWAQQVGSAPGVTSGNIAIPFLANDDATPTLPLNLAGPSGLGQRIAAHINQALTPTEGIVATVFGNHVELNQGEFVLAIANPPANYPLQVRGEGPGGNVTGLWDITPSINTQTRTYLAVSDRGGVYVAIVDYLANQTIPYNPPTQISNLKVEQITTRYIGTTENDFAGVTAFQGLTRGPATVEGGRYNNTFFAVADGTAGPTDQSSMLAFNFNTAFANPAVSYPAFVAGLTSNVPATLAAAQTALNARYGGLAPIFVDGQSSVPLFYTDSATATRLPVRNAKGLAFSSLDRNLWHTSGTRGAEPGHGINANNNGSRAASGGGSSLLFGNDGGSQWVGNTYNFPGGAYGSVITNEFDLSGYSTYDQPVMYFNYRADAEQSGIFDSFRVFISGVADADRDGIPDNNPGEWTQITSTATNVFVGQGWRQARLSLDNFAGMTNLRLRFDFSTGGDMNTGDTLTTGDELQAVKGEYIRDEQTFDIDTTTFEFDSGSLLTFPTGQIIGDGETFTFDDGSGPVTFEFDKPGTAAPVGGNFVVDITNTMTADQVGLQVFQAILNSGLAVVPRILGGTKLTPFDATYYFLNGFDGATFTIDDGTTTPQIFEFDDIRNSPGTVVPGAIAVQFDPGTLTIPPWNQARMAQEIVRSIRLALPLQVTPTFEAPNQVLVENAIQVIDNTFFQALFQDVRYYNTSNILQIENAVGTLSQTGGVDINGAAIPARVQVSGAPDLLVPGGTNILVHYNIGQRATDIAATIDGLLEQVFYTPKLTLGNGSQYQDGQIFTLDDDGPAGPNLPVTFEFESGYVITMPANGGALPAAVASTVDGDQISIDDDGAGPNPAVVFQFVNTSLPVPLPLAPGAVAVNFLATHSKADISRTLVAAINGTALNVNARVVANSNVQIDTTGNALVDYQIIVSSLPGPGKYGTIGTPDVATGNIPILFSPTTGFTSTLMVQSVITAITGQFGGITPVTVANAPSQVALNGADAMTLTLTALPAVPVSLVATNNIAKRDRDLLRIIGHTVTDRGPLGLEVPTTGIVPLQSDVPDLNDGVPVADGYRSIRRGQNNNFEGVYIDDFVIGLAERGEMGTNGGAVGANTTTFAANPQLNPNQILVGAYQLELRRSPTYEFVSPTNPGITPNSNDRFTNSYTIDSPAGSNIADGQTFTLSDGINRVTFEFDEVAVAGNPGLPNSIIAGNQRIPFAPGDTSDEIAHAIRDAINSPQVQATLKLLASLGDGTLPGVTTPAGLPSTTTRVNIVGSATTTVQNLQTQNAAELNPSVGNDTLATAVVTGFTGSQYFIQGTIGDNPVLSLSRGTQADDVDLFSFVVSAAQAANANYRVRIDIDAESLGSTLSSVLRVFDSLGNELAFSSNEFAPGEQQPGELTTTEAYLEFDPPATGVNTTYYVGVTSDAFYDPTTFGTAFGGSTGWYQLELTSALPSAVEPIIFTDKLGDWNHFRDQGQILLFGNEIRNSSQWGILIDSGARSATDGNAPHQGPARVLREINTTRQVPGVVVMNNTIYNGTLGGILFSGDTLTDAAIPFGRIVNNSLYGRGGTLTNGVNTDIGISVTENAAPTLLNNILANFRTGVNVDASSQGLTILGGMLYQGNTTVSNVGLGGDFPIALPNNLPLYVNPQQGNFYLKAQSQAIDSSVDSLLDRPAMVTIRDPLGIAPSPILSPDRDGVGQLRVNDPDVSTPQGFGLNPFKDRGAIDRVDFAGPTSFLINPLDNDAAGVDLDSTSTVVVLTNQVVNDFRIRLLDRFDPNGPAEGSDIDDFTVDTTQVIVEEISTGTPILQQDGVNYTFSYDATNNIIILTPTGGLWPQSQTYKITLNNAAIGGIADRAGNILGPNQTNGTHTYTIFLGTAKDWGDAPDTTVPPGTFPFLYHTRAADGGPSHSIVPGFHLGDSNGAEADGQPSLNANSDPSDELSAGGITNINIEPGAGTNTSSIDVLANFPTGTTAILDGWIDVDQSGTFDSDERFISGVTIAASNTVQTISFTVASGGRGASYARFRLTSAGIASPDGPATDGEVEDYLVTLEGPLFTNPSNPFDVTNDGIVSPTDLLTVINFITFLRSRRDNTVDPDGAGPLGFFDLFLPPTSPGYFAPPPTFDPTGGGVPGFGKYVDVAAPFGVLDINNDLLGVINYIIANFNGSGGEGEAATAAASPQASAAAAGNSSSAAGTTAPSPAATFSAPAVMYASSSVILEEREVVGTSLAGEELLPQSGAGALDLAFVEGNLSAAPAWGSLADHARRKASQGPLPLDQDDWDDLLGDLALDVGGLRGNSEDQA